MTNTVATSTLSNAVDSFDAVMRDTITFAGKQGEGANARANWLLRVVRGAANGALDTATKDKDGRDHAVALYDAYASACSKKNSHNAKTIISKASNLRKGIELGAKWGDDAIAVMNDAVAIYKVLTSDENIKTHGPFEAFNFVIRSQLASATRLSKDEVRAAMIKEEASVDVTTHIRTALRAIERAYKMEPNDKITEAMDAVNAALTFVTTREERAATLAKIEALQAQLAA